MKPITPDAAEAYRLINDLMSREVQCSRLNKSGDRRGYRRMRKEFNRDWNALDRIPKPQRERIAR